MLKRIEELRDRVLSADDRTVFIERFVHLKRAYEKYREEPPEIRHALITSEILDNISIVIDEDDFIVGRVRETTPTAEEEKLLQEIYTLEPDTVPPHIYNYASRPEVLRALFPEATDSLGPYRALPAPSFYNTDGHTIPDWETLLRLGINGIKETAREKLESITGEDTEADRKRRFLRASIISCDAVTAFVNRYVQELERLIPEKKHTERGQELLRIKRCCERVPANPATTFHEAVQSIWFLDLILHQVIGARDYTLGRADQYLYPFYKKDTENGTITRKEALEILEYLFIKCNEVTSIISHTHGRPIYNYTITRDTKRSLCLDSVQYCTVGGKNIDGGDDTNEVSFLILEAVHELHLRQPNIIVRYFRGINPVFWLKAVDIARSGINTIAFYNDEVIIPAYEKCGILPRDAVDYAQIACCHSGLPGRSMELREYWFNLPKYLELALNDGLDPMIGLQMGLHTGTIDEFTTFDDFLDAFKAQIKYQIEKVLQEQGEYYRQNFSLKPFSFESVVMKDCIATAMDYKNFRRNPPTGTGYIYFDCLCGGIATVADSLAAVKKLVYEEGRMSLEELNAILRNNFEGQEKLRLELLNKFPKYGNDDDYVDSFAVDIAFFFVQTVIGMSNPYLGLLIPSIYSYHGYACHGAVTGATPDGRQAREPVSENQEAVNGMDRNGLTALLNSMAKFKDVFSFTPCGGSTISIHPTGIAGENGTKLLSGLIETYFENGGQHVQTNVVNKETLIDAKKHPKKHRALLVRVTGYSAYFVTLSPECQDYIIERAAHLA
ncbi:MAG: hypothetical protein JXQ30_00480 [Spirochaetes bacterium]|nr:hypothetical protein [Spirochaetota bacterium]